MKKRVNTERKQSTQTVESKALFFLLVVVLWTTKPYQMHLNSKKHGRNLSANCCSMIQDLVLDKKNLKTSLVMSCEVAIFYFAEMKCLPVKNMIKYTSQRSNFSVSWTCLSRLTRFTQCMFSHQRAVVHLLMKPYNKCRKNTTQHPSVPQSLIMCLNPSGSEHDEFNHLLDEHL